MHKISKLTLALCLAAVPVWAATPSYQMEEIIVTATKPDADITTSENIDSKYVSPGRYASIPDLLRYSAGIDVRRRGVYGDNQNDTVKIRGLDANRYNVLIDGQPIKMSGVMGGNFIDWNSIPLENIEKIQITKGGKLASSGDIAGTINIITKKTAVGGSATVLTGEEGRAEYRLSLREDNADVRLTEEGRRLGLVDDERWAYFCRKQENVARLMQSLKDTWVNPKLFTSEEMNRVLGTDMEREYSLHALATRPGVTLKAVAGMTKTDGAPVLPLEDFSDDELFQAETEVKYSGYISRQKAEIERTLANETLKIPAELDYDSVPGLSFEVRQKLKSISPETIGQASRISGVTPAAVSLLLVHLKRRYYYVKDKGTQAKEKGNV